MKHPSISNIVSVVRRKGREGCTVRYVAGICGETEQAVRKALDLQVQAGAMSTEELFDGERYVGTLYRMREGA